MNQNPTSQPQGCRDNIHAFDEKGHCMFCGEASQPQQGDNTDGLGVLKQKLYVYLAEAFPDKNFDPEQFAQWMDTRKEFIDLAMSLILQDRDRVQIEAFMLGQGYSFIETPGVSYANGYYERTDPDGIDNTVCNEYVAREKYLKALSSQSIEDKETIS